MICRARTPMSTAGDPARSTWRSEHTATESSLIERGPMRNSAATSPNRVSGGIPTSRPSGGSRGGAHLCRRRTLDERGLWRRKLVEQAPRLGVAGIEPADGLELGAGRGGVTRLQMRLDQDEACRDRVLAPDRDLELFDGLLHASAAQVGAAEEQVRLAVIRGEVNGAAQLGNRFRVTL